MHLESVLKLARLMVVTIPVSPGFYNRPEIVDCMVGQVLDYLESEHDLGKPWG